MYVFSMDTERERERERDRQTDRQTDRPYVHSAVVYKKYLTRLGSLIIVEAGRDNCQFSQMGQKYLSRLG